MCDTLAKEAPPGFSDFVHPSVAHRVLELPKRPIAWMEFFLCLPVTGPAYCPHPTPGPPPCHTAEVRHPVSHND